MTGVQTCALPISPEEGNGYPLQYSGLENSVDCIVHGDAKSQTQLSDFKKKNYVLWLVTQSCLTLCDPMDCIVQGILQARILEWVAFPFSRGSSQPRD